MSIAVVTAADGAAWEASLLNATETGALGISIVRRCIDVVELVSVALSGQARVAVVSSRLRGLDADVIDQLLVAGVATVAVLAQEEQRERDAMHARGISRVVAADADPTVIASVIRDAEAVPDDAAKQRRAYSMPGPVRSVDDPEDPKDSPGSPEVTPSGKLVAVWGPTGAPGRSTVAASLADEISRLGADVTLVDADVYGGSLATRFGLLDESPGLAAACRIASSALLDAATLVELAWQLAPRLRLVTGIPLAQRWPEIRPSSLESVLRVTRCISEWVVVDLGFSVEADEELSFDALIPRRNGATIAVLEAADVVLVVGDCDPVGMQRLANALIELDDAGLAQNVQVVLNKTRAKFGSADPDVEASVALERITSRTPIACLPYDREALDACLAAGRSLGELRQRSPLRQAVSRLAQDVTGIDARSRARRHARR